MTFVLHTENETFAQVHVRTHADVDIVGGGEVGETGETGIGRFKLRNDNAGLLVSNCLWDMDSTKSWIEIESLDTSKRILKGAFECKSSTNFCGNGVISNGSFEVKY